MDPHAFIAEVYRRMALRHATEKRRPTWGETQTDPMVMQAACSNTRPICHRIKQARILDIGFGSGWFLGACLKLGYRICRGADFAIANKELRPRLGSGPHYLA